MAAGSSSLSLGDELNCPICLNIFSDPVMLECGHDFCRQCILQSWEREKKAFCPECGEVFRDKKLKANRALGVLSNKLRNLSTKELADPKLFNPLCEEHQEELKLFCETDKKLICVMCLDRRDGRSHKAHNFMLINEAVEICKISRDWSLNSNRVLGRLVKKRGRVSLSMKVKGNRPCCIDHEEELKLFCETDKKLICVMCLDRRDGRSHKAHNFMLINEAEEICKEKMRANLQFLNQKKNSVQNVLLKQQQSISEIQEQSNNLQKHIMSEFAELRNILDDKERLLAKELADQEDDILKKMETNLRGIQEHLNETEEKLSNVQSQLTQQDAFILLKEEPDKGKSDSNYQTTVAEGKLPLGSFKGPIQYRVWRDIMEVINPAPASLTLDPSTAHPLLILSDDRTSVKLADKLRSASEGSEAPDRELSVLGATAFLSGRHYWEVNVGNKTAWDLGVVKEVIRKHGSRSVQDNGYWVLSLKNGSEYWLSTATPTRISVNSNPNKVGIYLDYEGGQLSFYNASNMDTLFTFTDNFTGKVYPYFSPGTNEDRRNSDPLTIIQFKNR